MPVLALGGAERHTIPGTNLRSGGRGWDTFESAKQVASKVEGGVIDDCGHWIAEEQPELLAETLNEFFQARESLGDLR